MRTSLVSLLLTLLITANPNISAEDYQQAYIEKNTRHLSIMFVGDLMVHGDQYRSSYDKANKQYDFNPWFEYTKKIFSAPDLAMFNMETTLTENLKEVKGYPVFRSPTSLAEAIKNAGFDIAGTANNHSLDNRLYGVETTLKYLRENEILTTGTYAKNEVAKPLIIEKNGFKLGVIASTYGTNGFPLPKDAPHVVNLTSKEFYDEQIKQLKEAQVDGIICFIHWGHEYHRKPYPTQVELANYLAEQGVDWIIGSHPHSIQPDDWIETSHGKTYVAYSLGNLVSNQRWRYSDTGLAVTLNISKTPDNVISTKVDYLPFWVDKYDEKGNMGYVILPLLNTPELKRISDKDKKLMDQALEDFYELYPQAK